MGRMDQGVSSVHTYKTNGFTIVELLIVIVVIGILAAITLVAFSGVRDRANNSALQSDLKNIGALLEQYLIIHETLPDELTDPSLQGLGKVTITKSAYGNYFHNGSGYYNLLYCHNDNNVFALVAVSSAGVTYRYEKGSVKEHGAMLSGSNGTCQAAGVNPYTAYWGYAYGSWRAGL